MSSPSTIESYKSVFEGMKLSSTMLQTAMVVHLEYLMALPKADVMADPGLAYLFNNVPKSINRGAVAAWWVEFSPLRPVFKPNGAFEMLRWAVKGEWNLTGADDKFWADCVPETTAKPKVPEVAKAVEALFTALAKISKVNADVTPEDLIEQVQAYMPEAVKAVKEIMESKTVDKFQARVQEYKRVNGEG